MPKLPLIALALLTLGGCGAVVSDPAAPEPAASFSPAARIVFAADFATGDGCAAHDADGCDLFTAEIDWSGDVRSVTRITSATGTEVFPAFSADGATIYANKLGEPRQGDIIWVASDGSAEGTLVRNALGAAPLPDGSALMYVAQDKLSTADFSDAHTLANHRVLFSDADYREPHASETGLVILYRLFGGGKGSDTSQALTFDPATETLTELTPRDGTAHCFWNGTNDAGACNNVDLFRGIFSVPLSGAASSLLARHPLPKDLAALDADFASCKGASYAYGTFCDAEHLLVTVGCGVTQPDGTTDTTMSKLGLLDLSDPEPVFFPLGKALADAFGGPGSSSQTPDCLLLEQ